MALGLTAALASLPALVAALPADDPGVDPATLLQRLQTSDEVGWSGYGESRGDLVLPDVRQLEALPELISGTTRMRAWWRGREEFRVDQLTLVGERDVVVDGPVTWTWDSADRAATLTRGRPQVRLPRAADLLAPALGARLARSAATEVAALPARRVAGVDAAGIRLRPQDERTTVDRVDLWVEPGTGLAVRVEIYARDVEQPALTTELLDLQLSTPPADRTAFRPPDDVRVQVVEARDLASAADRRAPFRLPATLAGLARRERADVRAEGVATYGEGFTALTVVPLEGRTADALLRSLAGAGRDEAQFATVLLQGLVARERGRAYLLVGTVPQELLQAALADLRAAPPPERPS